LVAQGSVTEVSVAQDTIQGKLKDKLPSGKSAFITARVDPGLAEKLESKGVVVTGVPSGGLFQTILSWIIPAVMFYLIWVFFGRRLPAGSACSQGNSAGRAARYRQDSARPRRRGGIWI
jgi:cell division protease FtsH